ncbi:MULTISPECIES: SDR family oxidoreductase [Salipiger]|uniref:3-oxoacyl-(Acyl-carrier protein) reductase n=1 Tax=Salipiger profundus TaxID=1229727 RepID=A0A1U7DDH8_9RHOB|nr:MULTISPECIES: SDR family oxidoreductase [Salipiger]APX26178.1 3-oxoacyl-(acyl-carrier protein) reductase [Salipiger profundus]GGA23635.1 alcohol dehydrogenase [Salipiger profundus]
MNRLAGKVALITGAASGFGRGMAEAFVREGAKVMIADLNLAGAKAVAAEIGNAAAVGCDVSKAEQVEAAVAETEAVFGCPDIVINNAGWSNRNAPLMETDEATFRKIFDINVLSIFHMTRSMTPRWRAQGGGIMINVGSVAGIRPRPGLAWYNTSKGAVNLMTRTLAVELAADRIRVCGIAPVVGATGLLESFLGKPDTPENRAAFLATIPMGRFCTAEDVAGAALYLASDDARFITGVILEVDGGRTI